MDMETFFTILYVIIDDWYKEKMSHRKPRVGRPARLSDSEVLTLAVASQWRCGVAWQSERAFVRYMLKQGKALFPHMLQRSGFNRRVRQLYGVGYWSSYNKP